MKFVSLFIFLFFGAFSFAHADSKQCVKKCAERDYKGRCVTAAPDYCGVDARCEKRCITRNFNGMCAVYAPDFCGRKANCIERCVFTYNGVCNQYGADHCYTR